MLYLALSIFLVLSVVLDQAVKYLVVAHIPAGGVVQLVPGVVHLTYVQNRGAAFSMLEGGRWLFVAVFVLAIALVGVLVYKKLLRSRVELWCLAAILGGGLGNVIDRVLHGYVVDMFEVEFMRFAVFNVADIFVTCGAAVLIVYALLFDRSGKKQEGGHAADR